MHQGNNIGHAVKELNNLFKRNAFKIFRNSTITDNNDDGNVMPTIMQAWIIEYLCDNADKDIFQKDIEKSFEIRRSTATSILKLMEKNGYVLRKGVPCDARLKKIVVTPKAEEINRSIKKKIDESEEHLLKGISKEEAEIFFSVVEKIKYNINN